MSPTIAKQLKEASQKSVLVVGDVMVDEYLHGDASRISPEAPTPVVSLTHGEFRAGGAANAASNIASIGAKAILLGLIGEDKCGTNLIALLGEKAICNGLVKSTSRPTTQKTRVIARGQQIVRLDTEDHSPISQNLEEKLLENFHHFVKEADVVLLSDYAKGTLTRTVCERIIHSCQLNGTPTIVDPKGFDFSKYTGATIITPNLAEGSAVTNAQNPHQNFAPKYICEALKKMLPDTSIALTLGEHGIALQHHDIYTTFSTRARSVYDVTGAGDTVTAGLAVALACNIDMVTAIDLANRAAGLAVEKRGTATIEMAELLLTLKSTNP